MCVTVDMVYLSLAKTKDGKAAAPSETTSKMIKASGPVGAQLIADLANSIIWAGRIPKDWEKSFIINLYKGKRDALDRGNYRGLKLLDHVMKVIERVVEKLICESVSINESQFGFMPDRGTTDAIFILRQIQETFLSKNKQLFFAFVDLQKAFDRVP